MESLAGKGPMAIKGTRQEAALRKIDRMFDGAIKHRKASKNFAEKASANSQAVKVPGKMGPSQRNGASNLNTRKDDKATRGAKMKVHFKKIFSGRSGGMQGKK